ncbi:MAG: presqualene diphosphate synthase HpnD [Brachymonas sp.]|nr:presqualene diphosphate synthase HpnD [Brachymonas sp.]
MSSPAPAASPQAYVQQKTAAAGSSFYYAFLFLPPQERATITAFYAFCREVDDVVDEALEPEVAAAKLGWWAQEVEQAYAGKPSHPVTQALLPHAAQFGIEARHLLAVVEGCHMDLHAHRYETREALQQYCHLVAGIVGEVSARIFGQTQAATTDYAHRLGRALQLTNIIRDVGEDALRGRIYLPADECQRFGVSEASLLQRQHSPAFVELMRHQAAQAHQCYAEALALLPAADRRAQKPGLMMAAIYRDLLCEIEKDGFQVLDRRTVLTPLRKFWLAWKVQALGRMPA